MTHGAFGTFADWIYIPQYPFSWDTRFSCGRQGGSAEAVKAPPPKAKTPEISTSGVSTLGAWQ